MPKTRREFWATKLNANVERDRQTKAELLQLGWNVLTVWECELDDEAQLEKRFLRELRTADEQ